MRATIVAVALVGLSLALVPQPAAAAKGKKSEKVRPIAKIDRTRIVGAPVLDDQAKPGLYVWLEDGHFHVAAVPVPAGDKAKRRSRPESFTLHVTSTKPIKGRGFGEFSAKGGDKSVRLTVVVRDESARGTFETEGDITLSDARRAGGAAALFIGPLAKPGAKTVSVGRF